MQLRSWRGYSLFAISTGLRNTGLEWRVVSKKGNFSTDCRLFFSELRTPTIHSHASLSLTPKSRDCWEQRSKPGRVQYQLRMATFRHGSGLNLANACTRCLVVIKSASGMCWVYKEHCWVTSCSQCISRPWQSVSHWPRSIAAAVYLP